MAEVFKILGSLESTQKQMDVAEQTAKDLTSMLITHTLDSITGRTALLAGLIVELKQVIDSIQQNPPYEEALGNLTNIITKTNDLFITEKKNLIQ